MTFNDLLTVWVDHAALSGAIWLILIWSALYLARAPAHELIAAAGRLAERGLRIVAQAVRHGEELLARRNREVLLSMAAESVERDLEREFERVATMVNRDLAGYPALQRELSQIITRIDEDYRASTEEPPVPPPWTEAVEALARIETRDPTVARVLEDIRGTLEKSSRRALDEYRKKSRKRHDLLKRMQPYWRKLTTRMRDVSSQISGLEKRAAKIDAHMDHYEKIRAGDDATVRTLSSSSLSQFLIAGLVLVIATFGAIINFHLIALPMSEMVGGNSYIGPMLTADVASLMIILVEIMMGLFLMESLSVTRLFPVIGALDDRKRHAMAWAAFSFLFLLAGVEAALAYMRDMLVADQEALVQMLSNSGESDEQAAAAGDGAGNGAALRMIPAIGQMLLGFILPLVLVFVAIPLESFMHAARTVAGVAAIGTLRVLATVLRVAASLSRGTARVVIQLYDVVIFLPLAVERATRGAFPGARSRERED